MVSRFIVSESDIMEVLDVRYGSELEITVSLMSFHIRVFPSGSLCRVFNTLVPQVLTPGEWR